MPGPAKKPTKLKILEGNPGKRRLPQNEPNPTPAIPSCPSYIKGVARKEWKLITPELYILGILTKIDRMALAGYCIACGQLAEVEHELAKMKKSNRELSKLKRKNPNLKTQLSNGLVSITSNGNAIMEPLLSVRKQAMELMHKFAAEFGMTPAARARVNKTGGREEQDPLDRVLNTGKRVN